MKKLHLIRHAKSSWKDLTLTDIDRPLNKRGIRSCELMSQHIWDAGCHFDNVFCSPAVRAESTIELINTHLSDIEIKWETTDELYTFESKSLFDWCKSLDDSLSEIAIVGHNPALTDFCHSLSGEILQTIPTCGYTQLISRAINSWSELSDVTFKIERILWPKALTL